MLMFTVTTFSSVVAKINSHSGQVVSLLWFPLIIKLRLSGTGVDLKVENYATDLPSALDRSIGVQKVCSFKC